MTNKLDPCPFCGGEVERDNPMPDYVSGHGFHCLKCNAYFQLGDDDIEATHHWNTRYKRTCRKLPSGAGEDWACSNCGAYNIHSMFRDAGGHSSEASNCPACGAEVIDDD